ncbi:MAG: hypothetical protein ABIN55_01105, partial [Aeromicrobium sp.]
VAKGDVTRLVDIQGALVKLILELDPKQRYTTGYDLTPISDLPVVEDEGQLTPDPKPMQEEQPAQ